MKTRFLLSALLLSMLPAAAQTPEDFITGEPVDYATLDGGTLLYKSHQETAGAGTTLITRKYMDDLRTVSVTTLSPSSAQNLARGPVSMFGWRDYWVNALGQVRTSGTLLTTGPSPDRISTSGKLDVTANRVFWTDEEGEFLDGARLFTASSRTAGAYVTIADYSVSPRLYFRSLYALSDSAVVGLLSNGVVRRWNFIPGSPPFGIGFWLSSDVRTGVAALLVQNSRYYWHEITGTATNFYSAPVDTPSSSVWLGTQSLPTGTYIDELAVGDGKLFYQRKQLGGGDLLRRSATAFGTAETVANLPYLTKLLQANDRWVIWIKNSSTLTRLPIGAAAITRNLTPARLTGTGVAAPMIEVIQAIQNPGNGCPLVANKTTWARTAAIIESSSAGETALTLSPAMVLHGSRSGVALPGSPLTPQTFPHTPPPVRNVPGDRAVQADGYWFQLPPAWTVEGTTVLRAQVNPHQLLSETTVIDNSTANVSAVFTPKVPIGLKFIPTVTHYGTISRYAPYMQDLFDTLEALFPTSDLRWEFPADLLDEDHTFSHSPFEFTDHDDDGGAVLDKLYWKMVFGSGGQLAQPGGFDHYVALMPGPAAQAGYSGYATLGWDLPTGTQVQPAHLFFVNHARDGLGIRSDVGTAAQELAHNYGRGHVNCGDPDGVDFSYPYDPATLSSPTAGYQGWDPVRRRLILPTEATDYMSYCPNNWTSDHTWRNLYSRISTGYGPALASPPVPRGGSVSQHLVTGVYDPATQTSTIHPAVSMDAAAALRAQARQPQIVADFRLYAMKEDGTPLAWYPVGMMESSADEGHRHAAGLSWSVISSNFPPDTAQLQLIKKLEFQTPAAIMKGGNSAPLISILNPTTGASVTSGSLLIKWDSSDAETNNLAHMVRISHDNGNTWRMLQRNWPDRSYSVPVSSLPGGGKCRAEVTVSDGILCATAISGEFSIPNKAPDVSMLFENGRGKICASLATAQVDCGEALVLHATGSDIEDGALGDSSFTWTIAGPVTRNGTGSRFEPAGLIPGLYSILLTAEDQDEATTSTSATLTVRPAYIEEAASAISVDGIGSEPAYASDRISKELRYPGGTPFTVHMVHRSGMVHVSAAGLSSSLFATHRFVIGADLTQGAGPPQTGDWLLEFNHNTGALRLLVGNGTTWVPSTDPASTGVLAARYVSGSFLGIELAIPDSMFGGWSGQSFRLLLGDLDRASAGDSAFWPASAGLTQLNTWAMAAAGSDPEPIADDDRDGMPDAWERSAFGNTAGNATRDRDGDGQSDAAEYIAGTSPTSLLSQFSAEASANGVQWMTAVGRSYTIWRSPDLIAWIPVASGISGGPSPMFTGWTDTSPPAGKAFYKVEAHICR